MAYRESSQFKELIEVKMRERHGYEKTGNHSKT